jgi:hypothetical protein
MSVNVPNDDQCLVSSDVPDELWVEIALDLDALDVLALSQVCSFSNVCAIVAYRPLRPRRRASPSTMLSRGGDFGPKSSKPYVNDAVYSSQPIQSPKWTFARSSSQP